MENTNMETLRLSIDYVQSEATRGHYVHDFIKDYSKRNKIGYAIDSEDNKIVLTFKSENQKACFVRRGNNKFPHFEFW